MKNIIRVAITAVVLSLGLVAPSAAGPLEDGLAAYGRGDYATAIQLLRPFADQGNADAQSRLGLLYANGRGVPQDDAAAANWYQKAADQGNADAQVLRQGVPLVCCELEEARGLAVVLRNTTKAVSVVDPEIGRSGTQGWRRV